MVKIFFVHIKLLRGNFFLMMSNTLGELIWKKSCGVLGFKNIEKRSKDSFKDLLRNGIEFILSLKLDKNHRFFLTIEGAKKEFLKQICIDFINVLTFGDFKFSAIKLLNKGVHNGCRKPLLSK